MCGIAGGFAYRGGSGVECDAIARMSAAMVPRGPDGDGVWVDDGARVCLAHRRLAIIDLSPLGAQPMELEPAGLSITFNGEIYNYRQLRADLEAKGRVFRSHSDTEVLLHLYDEYGPEMCRHLRGMFAFGIWDARRGGLFLARDHFGIKPVYLSDSGGVLLFASSVKALLESGRVPTDPDPAGHVSFFLWGNIASPHTLYRAIRPLPAGCSVWVDERGVGEPVRYFSMSQELAELEGTARPSSQAETREALASALRESLAHHFVADVPVGVFLSAGRDSSTILGLAAEVTDQPLVALTLAFEEFAGTSEDEAPLAAQIAAHYGARHELRTVRGADFRGDLDRIFKAMDQPSVDGLNTYFVSKVTHECGVKVALSGLGADELFGGYPSAHQIPKLVESLKGGTRLPWLGRAFRVVSQGVLKRFTSPKYAGLLEYGGTYSGAYLLRRGLFMPWELPHVLDPDLAREGWGSLRALASLDDLVAPLSTDEARVCALESQVYMRNRLLRDSDWAGMAHSLEIRVPFVDIGLFRAMAPFIGGGHSPTKADMALSPRKRLPDEVLNRPKTGFGVPVREWLLGENPGAGGERSLRGWARLVYTEFTGR